MRRGVPASLLALLILVAPLRPVTAAPRAFPASTPIFDPYQVYAVDGVAASVAVLDATGDGLLDVAVGTSGFEPQDYGVDLFVQLPDGSLQTPPLRFAASGIGAMRLGTADVNRDGRQDLLVAEMAGIDVLLQKGNGLTAPRLLRLPGYPNQVVRGDVDGDGDDDLFTSGPYGVLLLRHVGSSWAWSRPTDKAQMAIAVGDVTADGRLDLLGYTDSTVHVFPQLSDGTFGSHIDYEAVQQGSFLIGGLDVADVTGDGRADSIVTIEANRPTSVINVFPQLPTGTFGDPAVYDSYDVPDPIVARDVDGDGRNDVITLHSGWLYVGVYYQAPTGELQPEVLYPIPYAQYGTGTLDAGDISGDGLVDIVEADYNAGLVVLRQRAP